VSRLRRGHLLPIVLLPSDHGGRQERWSVHGPFRGVRRRMRHLFAGPRVQGRPTGRKKQGLFHSAAIC
jgi:hypothetical protein